MFVFIFCTGVTVVVEPDVPCCQEKTQLVKIQIPQVSGPGGGIFSESVCVHLGFCLTLGNNTTGIGVQLQSYEGSFSYIPFVHLVFCPAKS